MLHTYRVRLTATVYEDVWIDVLATSDADAETEAIRLVGAGGGESTFVAFAGVTVDSTERRP